MERFAGQVALVTGAASGIGAASAARLAAEGASVVLADIDEDRARQVADTITTAGGTAVAVHCDVGSLASWRELADRVSSLHGRVDVVHNNAFALDKMAADVLPEASWDRQLSVSLSSVYYSARTLLSLMTGPAPAMVNTSSVHALIGLPGHPAYAAAKGAIVALTRQLAVEYGPRIRVNAVAPGPILTPVWRDVPEAQRMAVSRATVAGRMGHPEEVAAAVAFLASADAAYITGTTLLVDGGYLATRSEGEPG
jgi:NAD(P)-dependent dehydrogenase (short-subunit alcohol dehydrogenase family)